VTVLSDAPPEQSPVVPQSPGNRRRLVAGAGALVAVAGIFLYFWCRSDMWLDEALSVNVAQVPLGSLPDALRQDGAPPLYYVLLKLWTDVLGTSDVAARSLSGVCMLGAVVVTWFAARRFAGTTVAWLSSLVMLTSPFAFRYATEARMYALEILLVAAGILAFQRAIESPTIGRVALFGVLVAIGVYTQYWVFYIVGVAIVMLGAMVWRGVHRTAAVRLLVATGLGLLTLAPWLPTLLYQREHTGTPWGTAQLPGLPIAHSLRDFAGGAPLTVDLQEGWLLLLVLVPALLLGAFGRPRDDRHIEIDVRLQPAARPYAIFGAATLVVALSLTYVAGDAFQTRYSALVFPFFVLLVARGLSTLRDPRILLPVLVVVVVLGLIGGIRNSYTQRTEAGMVAAVLRARAAPGDLVVYCPDQLGPSVHRLAPAGLDERVYPSLEGPERIDWVDYKARVAEADPGAFAQRILDDAQARTIWLVSAPGYATHPTVCQTLGDAFAAARSRAVEVAARPDVFEKQQLEIFPAP
jgi:hypothetical protein